MFWLEVKYIEDPSLLTSSKMGSQASNATPFSWPFLNIVIGLPLFPSLLHGFCGLTLNLLKFSLYFPVEENLKELPNLPSKITSPSWGYKFLISEVSS